MADDARIICPECRGRETWGPCRVCDGRGTIKPGRNAVPDRCKPPRKGPLSEMARQGVGRRWKWK